MRNLLAVGLVMLGVAGWPADANAGFISGPGVPQGSPAFLSASANVTSDLIGITGNDNVGITSLNTIAIAEVLQSNGIIDIVFTVTNSGGIPDPLHTTVQEYLVTKTVTSSLPVFVSLSSMTFQLGTGSGGSFVKSTVGDGLDFDTPNLDSPVILGPRLVDVSLTTLLATPTVTDEDQFFWADTSLITTLGVGSFLFAIDVPNISTFTLRQIVNTTPVPEPSSILLSGLAMGGLGFVGWKRMRRGNKVAVATQGSAT